MQLWVQSLFTVILHLFSMVTQHETLNPSFVMGEECSVHLCPVHLGGGEEHLTLSIVTFCQFFLQRQSMLSRSLTVYLFECLCKWGRVKQIILPFFIFLTGLNATDAISSALFLPILEFYGGHLLASSSVLPSLEWNTSVVLGIISGSTSHVN